MSKRKRAIRFRASELAMQTLSELGGNYSERDAREALEAAPRVDEDSEPAIRERAWKLIEALLKNSDVLDRLIYRDTPAWLAAKLSVGQKILLRAAFYKIICEKVAPAAAFEDMTDYARYKSREAAFQTLYGHALSPLASLEELKKAYVFSAGEEEVAQPQTRDPGWRLTFGVWQNIGELDKLIDKFSRKWRRDRLGKPELTLLRLGLYQLFSGFNHPRAIIEETLNLGDRFGLGQAGLYVDGVLEAAAKAKAGGFTASLKF